MKHTVEELLAVVHHYYPRGSLDDASPPEPADASLRLLAARRQAAADDEPWCALLRRLDDRFPGAFVAERSIHRPEGSDSACYSAMLLSLAPLPGAHWRRVDFWVSFVVPYYVIRSRRCVDDLEKKEARARDRRAPQRRGGLRADCPPMSEAVLAEVQVMLDNPRRIEVSFDPAPDEQVYFEWLAREIEATFGHERMAPEVGNLIVPDVVAGNRWFGKASLYHCLFSPH